MLYGGLRLPVNPLTTVPRFSQSAIDFRVASPSLPFQDPQSSCTHETGLQPLNASNQQRLQTYNYIDDREFDAYKDEPFQFDANPMLTPRSSGLVATTYDSRAHKDLTSSAEQLDDTDSVLQAFLGELQTRETLPEHPEDTSVSQRKDAHHGGSRRQR